MNPAENPYSGEPFREDVPEFTHNYSNRLFSEVTKVDRRLITDDGRSLKRPVKIGTLESSHLEITQASRLRILSIMGYDTLKKDKQGFYLTDGKNRVYLGETTNEMRGMFGRILKSPVQEFALTFGLPAPTQEANYI